MWWTRSTRKKLPWLVQYILALIFVNVSSLTDNKLDENMVLSRHKRVVGGSDAAVGKHPWVVRIDNGGKTCTGTLITPCHVLTESKCIKNDNGIKMYLGENQKDDANVQIVTEKVPRVIDKAKSVTITITLLASCVDVNEFVAPINVANERIVDDTPATVYGWGETIPQSNVLQRARVVSKTDECLSRFDPSKLFGMLCAYENIKSIGDEGGPMVVPGIDDQPCLVGLTQNNRDLTDTTDQTPVTVSTFTDVTIGKIVKLIGTFIGANPCDCGKGLTNCKPALPESPTDSTNTSPTDLVTVPTSLSEITSEPESVQTTISSVVTDTHPWLARIENGRKQCSGTLITPCHIITKKTCVKKNNGLTVYLGEESPNDVNVQSIGELDPRRTANNDGLSIIVLQLEKCVEINEFVAPINVADLRIVDDSAAYAHGWDKSVPSKTPIITKTNDCIARFGAQTFSGLLCAYETLPSTFQLGGPLVITGDDDKPCMVGQNHKNLVVTDLSSGSTVTVSTFID
ncbi:unnamed protein product, partial [Owenia fusiformis]